MSELLVRYKDRDGHNPSLIGEGHVITVQDDGWPWSPLEREHPQWRILRVHDCRVGRAEQLMCTQFAHPAYAWVAARHFWIDVDKLPQKAKNWFADDSRSAPMYTITDAELEAAIVEEPIYPPANTLGAYPVIG